MESHPAYGVIIQARTSSTRLPGKVLLEILGQPMLFRQVDRLRKAFPDLPIVVATSDNTSDDPIENLCSQFGWFILWLKILV